MSPSRQIRLSVPLPTHTPPGSAAHNPAIRLALYLCCAAEIVFNLGGAVGSMPWVRLVESIICQRHVGDDAATTTGTLVAESGMPSSFDQMLLSMLLIGGKGGYTAEARCKGGVVQAEITTL